MYHIRTYDVSSVRFKAGSEEEVPSEHGSGRIYIQVGTTYITESWCKKEIAEFLKLLKYVTSLSPMNCTNWLSPYKMIHDEKKLA